MNQVFRRIIGALAGAILAPSIAMAASPIYGPLQVQNPFSEISANGSQAIAIGNLFGHSVTFAGAFGTAGAFGVTLTATGATNVTLPTSGTLATVGGALGTPASITLSNATGLPIATGIAGLGSGVATALAAGTNATGGVVTYGTALPSSMVPNLTGDVTTSAGAATVNAIGGNAVSLGGAFSTSGAFPMTLTVTGATNVTLPASGTLATVNGALGTPASVTLTHGTGLPLSTGVTGLGSGVAAMLADAPNASGGAYTYGTVLPAAMSPAYTGDVTSPAGSLSTTVGSIGGKSIALGGSFATSGSSGLTLVTTGTTSVTLPTSGTLITTASLASPPAIGGTTANSGAFTTLAASGAGAFGSDVTIAGYQTNSVAPGVSAAGTTQATATVLTEQVDIVTTVAANAGVELPSTMASGAAIQPGTSVEVLNRGANTLNVYPQSGATIETLAANAAAGVAVGGDVHFRYSGANAWTAQ